MKIKSIKINILNEPKKYYDISVPEYESFVVGKSKIVVHNSALNQAIIGMAQSYKNSMPLLDEIGQFGSLRSPEAGAPRYISTRLHPNFRLLYKDFELLESKIEEGNEIEPNFFLPIIPTVLLNGSSGIAVGFATNILNRNPKTLIDACLDHLDSKKIRELPPWIKDFTGGIYKDEEKSNRWIFEGKYAVTNTSTIIISELPPSTTYEKYEKHLNSKLAKKEIASYEDNCSQNINYEIKFSRTNLATFLKKEKIEDLFKLQEYETENLTTLDETGKLKIFKSAKDIVQYFVDFRLNYYQKRKDYLIDKSEYEVKILSNKARFIKGIIDNEIKVNKVPKDKIIESLSKLKFDKIDDSYSYLLSMAIHSLTKEKYDELMNQFEIKKAELIETKKLIPKEMYINDLKELKKSLK